MISQALLALRAAMEQARISTTKVKIVVADEATMVDLQRALGGLHGTPVHNCQAFVALGFEFRRE